MENFSVNIKKMNITSIIFSILFLIVGILLLCRPGDALNIVSYSLGGMLIIWGVIQMIQFFVKKNSQNYFDISFVVGIFVSIFGVIILLKPRIIADIIPLMLGIWMIINGVTKLAFSLTINKKSKSLSTIIIAIAIVVVGLLLVINPFAGAEILTQLIGVTMIVYSILDLVGAIFIRKTAKEVTKLLDDASDVKVIDAEYKEKKIRFTYREILFLILNLFYYIIKVTLY